MLIASEILICTNCRGGHWPSVSQIMQRGKIDDRCQNHILVILWKLTYTRTSNARPYDESFRRDSV